MIAYSRDVETGDVVFEDTHTGKTTRLSISDFSFSQITCAREIGSGNCRRFANGDYSLAVMHGARNEIENAASEAYDEDDPDNPYYEDLISAEVDIQRIIWRVEDLTRGGKLSGMLQGHPNEDAKRVGTIGDIDPIEYGGGYVYDGPDGPWVEYFDGLDALGFEEDADELRDLDITAYRADLHKSGKEFLSWYDWVDWDKVADSIGLDDLGQEDWLDRLNTPEDRALVLYDVAGYYGWHELDQYPLQITLGRLMVRWDEGNGLSGAKSAYDAMAWSPDTLVRDINSEIDDRDLNEIAESIMEVYSGHEEDYEDEDEEGWVDPQRSFEEPRATKNLTKDEAVEASILASQIVDWANYGTAYGDYGDPPWEE